VGFLRGEGRDAVEPLPFLDDVQELDKMILASNVDHLVEMTQHGTFTWRLRDENS
jgi:hypothetical protein